MFVEYSHRLTSGLTVLLVVGLLLWAWRAYARTSPVRLGAALAVFFTITEALIGAGLVLFGLTAENDSGARAFGIAIHLSNTFLLLAALTLTAFWASGGQPLRLREQGSARWFLALGLFGVLLLGITGAVTALGDTLFPASSLAEGFTQDFAAGATTQLLLRLRVIHPFIAMMVGAYTLLLARGLAALRPSPSVKTWAAAVTGLVATQWVVGVANIYWLAPIWLQMVHLFLADLTWIALLMLTAVTLSETTRSAATMRQVWRAILTAGPLA